MRIREKEGFENQMYEYSEAPHRGERVKVKPLAVGGEEMLILN